MDIIYVTIQTITSNEKCKSLILVVLYKYKKLINAALIAKFEEYGTFADEIEKIKLLNFFKV